MSKSSRATEELGLGRFAQIGFVVRRIDDTLKYYEKTLGLGTFDTTSLIAKSNNGISKLRISVARLSGIQFELIEPIEGDEIHSSFLRNGQEGLHHLGFHVNEIDKKITELERKGTKVLEKGEMLATDGKPLGIRYAYLDTAHTSGVIYELLKF